MAHAAASQLRHRTPVPLWVGAAGKPSGETGPLPGQADIPSFSPKREETPLSVSLCCGSMGREGAGASQEAGDDGPPAARSWQRWGASGWCEQPPRVGEGDPRGAAPAWLFLQAVIPRGGCKGRAMGTCAAPEGDGTPPSILRQEGEGGRNAARMGTRRSWWNPTPAKAAGRVSHYPALTTSPQAAPLFLEGRVAEGAAVPSGWQHRDHPSTHRAGEPGVPPQQMQDRLGRASGKMKSEPFYCVINSLLNNNSTKY